MVSVVIFLILFLVCILALCAWLFSLLSKAIKVDNALMVSALFIASMIFLENLSSFQQDYNQLADGVDLNYTPFATNHSITLFTFFSLSFIALALVWIKQRALPPLILVVAVSLIIIGVIIDIFIVIQVAHNAETNYGGGFMFLPFFYILTASVILSKLVKSEATLSADRTYASLWLNRLNNLMANTKWQPLWMILMTLPVCLLIMLILITFGQAPDAITKVFTDTTNWTFSTKSHPPLIEPFDGHYLCTVAACGDANVVKPLGWGRRHGYPILVNRQLQIANAFEEMIQNNWPRLHRIIRNAYDQYGYPLSKKITKPAQSNLTYRLMKPLEYFFLLMLYLCCLDPEHKINKQYAAK